MRHLFAPAIVFLFFAVSAIAQLPPPPTSWADWPMNVVEGQPGAMSADAWLDKPAGRDGPIVIRNGHFYSGNSRVRFWGVNLAFGANFPTHEEADRLASRFARYGINAVRFHHMDNQAYPNGIFADAGLETLSPVALERLDYFIAALKRNGVYADLNLHVSRSYAHFHKDANGHDGPVVDKIVDIFDPDLIAAQKRFASDLLQHFNVYTHARYADEPAVAIVEINNENSLFMWGSEKTIANLPLVYHEELSNQWNRWLIGKYKTREGLQSAWAVGEEKLGESLVTDGDFLTLDEGKKPKWSLEQDGSAKMKVSLNRSGIGDGKSHGAVVDVTAIDAQEWHLQLSLARLHLEKGRHYTLSFNARSDQAMSFAAAVSQAHEPWGSMGLFAPLTSTPRLQTFTLGVEPAASEDNARVVFELGRQTGRLYLSNVSLRPGGRTGLDGAEDPTSLTVQTPPLNNSFAPNRQADWYLFLQQTEENYYVGMMNFLKTDTGVKCPITGTIGFGPMNTQVQSKMDFVDAHAYWEHPSFPHKQWDQNDWVIGNQPMVDHPSKATLWSLGATRVAGKPFTVTEYQHPAPNDWQAECIPFIATYAALQDWDGVFLFAYSHNSIYDKDKISSFFDIEGNPAKMPLMPMGARLFSAIRTAGPEVNLLNISAEQLQKSAPKYLFDQGGFVKDILGVDMRSQLNKPTAIRFGGESKEAVGDGNRAIWIASTTPGNGRFIFGDATAAVFIGFAKGEMPIDLSKSGARIESLSTPFATIIVTPESPDQDFAVAEKLLISAVARVQNAGMQWDTNRRTVQTHWGNAPAQIEVVNATISLPGEWKHAMAVDASGNPFGNDLARPQGNRTVIHLGTEQAIGYEIRR